MADGERSGLRELVARGRAHYLAGEYPEAITCLATVLGEKAPYADVYDMLGVIYHQEGRLAEAEEMFREALRINPAYTEAALNLVVTCNDLGKYADAKQVYEQAMAASKRAPRELDPFAKGKIANMHAEVGATYRAVALYEEAVREYERALALCPTFVDIRTELGNTRREMGDVEGAIRELEHVRAESPRFVAGRLQLGLSYYAAGRRDHAGAEWRAVLEAAPGNRSARMYLSLLDPAGKATGGQEPGA
jgi:tetratricopeptide (TPR) repeat protein